VCSSDLSKLSAEAYVQAYSSTYNFPATIFRFFNVFGPRQRPDHEYAAVLPKWIWLAMQNKPIEVFGDGTASRDFTYVETVLDVAITAMRQKIFSEGAINLAFGNRISLNESVALLKKHFPNLQVNYVDQRPGDVKDSQNSPSLLNSLFPDIKPKPFEDALTETVGWLKEFGQTVANRPKTSD
jgi:UDP-glucose 4-epimerase